MVAAGDAIGILGSFMLSVHLFSEHMPLSLYIAMTIAIIVCQWLVFDACDLYNLSDLCNTQRSDIINNTISPMLVVLLLNVIMLICVGECYSSDIGVIAIIVYVLTACIFMVMWRYTLGEIIAKKWKPMRLAIMAPEEIIQPLYLDLKNVPLLWISTHTILSKDNISDENNSFENSDPQEKNRLAAFLEERDFDILAFFSSSGFLSDSEVEGILRLPVDGKQVSDVFALYEILTGKVPLRMVDGHWLLKRAQFQSTVTRTYAGIKRLLDVVVSGLALGLLAPLILLICGAVKAGSRGPVLFVQERLGQNFRTFKCYKFRTMIDGAEDKCGEVWASPDDPRITAIGRLLRKSRLDELPQLWNVLKGEMTLVGPRPIRESFARELEEHIPFYRFRFFVKPGLTGWAQVNYDYAGSLEGQFEKFQYDLFYVEHMSFVLDLLILFKTVKTIIRQRGT